MQGGAAAVCLQCAECAGLTTEGSRVARPDIVLQALAQQRDGSLYAVELLLLLGNHHN